MINSTKFVYIGLIITGLLGLGTVGVLGTNVMAQEMNMTDMAGGENMTEMGSVPTFVARDSVALNLGGTTLPAGKFLHLYDATPYHIMNGHVAVNVPCADDSTPAVQVLLGQAPNVTEADLENVPELSTPGDLCIYHVDVIPSDTTTATGHEIITDIALINAGESDVEFPPGSSAVVGINEIMPGAGEHHGEEEGTE